jgi:hypothetical protein
MEMGDDIYLLYFKTEGVDQETDTEEGGDDKGGKGDKGDDDGGESSGEEDFLDEDLGKEDKDHTPQKDETPKNLDNNQKGASSKNAGKKTKETVKENQVVRNLFCYLEDDPEAKG